jgi:acetoin utilization protein AcuB
MRAPAITAALETPVEEVARLLRDNKIGCLPVVEAAPSGGETLVGIVTESDVFAAFGRAVGIGAPGSPVVVRLQDPAVDLLRVAAVLAGRDAALLSLFTEPLPPSPGDAPGRSPLRLTLRLGTIDPRPVAGALAVAGLPLERPAREPAGDGRKRIEGRRPDGESRRSA